MPLCDPAHPVDAIIMMAAGGGGGIVSLIIGIVGLVKAEDDVKVVSRPRLEKGLTGLLQEANIQNGQDFKMGALLDHHHAMSAHIEALQFAEHTLQVHPQIKSTDFQWRTIDPPVNPEISRLLYILENIYLPKLNNIITSWPKEGEIETSENKNIIFIPRMLQGAREIA